MSVTSAPTNGQFTGSSRRSVERIELFPPLLGHLGSTPVIITDISVHGAGIQHHGVIPVSTRMKLTFRWKDEEVVLSSRVRRSRLVHFAGGRERAAVYFSGLAFEAENRSALAPVVQIIETSIRRALETQRRNATGEGAGTLETGTTWVRIDPSGDAEARSLAQLSVSRDNGYVCYRLEEGSHWRKGRTSNPAQPSDGFTVGATEDPQQLDLLCDVYQHGAPEMRSMIRLLAEISVREGSHVSHRLYRP